MAASPDTTEDFNIDDLLSEIHISENTTEWDGTGAHPNLKFLSHSSNVLLHKCPRKYEIYKMAAGAADPVDIHLDFGQTVGIGIAEYLKTGSLDKAAFAAMLSWKGTLDDEAGSASKKTFFHALFALDRFSIISNSVLANCELVYFNGIPALELGFSIDFGNGYKYRGFLDGLLLNKLTGELIVLELKTTGSYAVHEASYKHSGQALGYSLIIDAVCAALKLNVKSSYKVLYCIYKTKAYEWEPMQFTKSHTQRALWLKNVLLDISHIEQYAAEEYFPMHGESCYDFFRPCEYFGTCEFSNDVMFADTKVKTEAKGKYMFEFSLEEIIASQLGV